MRKGILTNGKRFYGIKIEHFVTKTAFSTALANYFFRHRLPFNESLTKIEAKKLLRTELFHYGIRGENETTMFESAIDIMDELNDLLTKADKWIDNNYPYLTNKTT